MSALQNVMIPMYFAGKRNGIEEATRHLNRVGLGNLLHHLPTQMRGGEIQRAAIARALANNPEIVLADEPTGNLDSKTADEVVALLRENNESGNTVLIVTHNSELASKLPHMVTIRDGRMVMVVPPVSHASGKVYGNPIDKAKGRTVEIAKIFSDSNQYVGKEVIVEGKAGQVCQTSGCWLLLTDSDNNQLYVQF